LVSWAWSASSALSWSAGTFANAAFVGANTVKGPVPLSVEARSAFVTALTSVLKSGFPDATSTIVSFAAIAVVVVVAFAFVSENETLSSLLHALTASTSTAVAAKARRGLD
jgi:hypothetical protein